MPDKIDKAVEATTPSPQLQMAVFRITIAGTNRPAQIVVPMDISADELREVLGWMAVAMWQKLQAQRGPKLLVPNLVVPRD